VLYCIVLYHESHDLTAWCADADKHLRSRDWDEHSTVERRATHWPHRRRTASYAGEQKKQSTCNHSLTCKPLIEMVINTNDCYNSPFCYVDIALIPSLACHIFPSLEGQLATGCWRRIYFAEQRVYFRVL